MSLNPTQHDQPETDVNRQLDQLADPDHLLESQGDYLYNYALSRVKNRSLAEDLVQETLLKGIQSIGSFRGDAKIRTWLTSILKHEIASHFRRESRMQQRVLTNDHDFDLSSLLHPEVSNSEFASRVEKNEFWEMIEKCFRRLPKHLLSAFLAKTSNDESSIEELCEDFGISSSNFAVRMFRARLLLRKCVEDTWIKDESAES